jgi:translocation and assembly module TamA
VNHVAGFDVSAILDTRDDPTDARHGHSVSLTVRDAPEWSGSDFTFATATLKASLVRPLRRLTWAQALLAGVGRGFGGQAIRSTERYRAGGASTVRGFATESLGPRDTFDDPLGGEAVLILNQELRYRHHSGLGGVVFYDAGNVFAQAEDLSLKLRHSLGAGIRYQSPVGLLRVDIGFPLARRTGEKAFQLFYSLGQAF